MGDTHFSGAIVGEGGIRVGSDGAKLAKVKKYTLTIDPSSVAADTVVSEEFTVSGLAVGDVVVVNPGVDTIGVAGAFVSAADTLKVIFVNPTASAIDPASSDWTVLAFTPGS